MKKNRPLRLEIRDMRPADYPSVARIYEEGIRSGNATFETAAPEWAYWDQTWRPDVRLVGISGGCIAGFAALAPTSKRPVYAGVCEVMIYVSERMRGKGAGGLLMDALVRRSEEVGVWTLTAGIFPENEASIKLHLRAGFRILGRRAKIGRTADGIWRDIVVVDRRSQVVGC